ncbi:MAG TPA: imidazole glycerol phosphate synthase subunit HisH [Rhodospirillaceae bacterium]|mgnify:CR=1 FL=1|jgi:glutamine amidotransferase|nr:imidazole glycerol phosphate synthase subunit HisH [Alphaproteobacteria bacterium]HBH26845.1 imidazole glycerol phosphate synthase subunit HisH [Rhodospirillaceae bacterium]
MNTNAAQNFIAVVDYGAGNLRSAARALQWAVASTGLSLAVRVTSRPEEVAKAVRIVLPGQGSFGACMAALRETPGMLETLEVQVRRGGVPFLGICVGMQLMADEGLEHGHCAGLGWIPGRVVPLRGLIDQHEAQPQKVAAIGGGGAVLAPSGLPRIPHMGWNEAHLTAAGTWHPLFRGLQSGKHFYFVHSFVVECEDGAHVLAKSEHGLPFACAVARDNMAGVQFHPEKSQRAGLALLENFVRWRP